MSQDKSLDILNELVELAKITQKLKNTIDNFMCEILFSEAQKNIDQKTYNKISISNVKDDLYVKRENYINSTNTAIKENMSKSYIEMLNDMSRLYDKLFKEVEQLEYYINKEE